MYAVRPPWIYRILSPRYLLCRVVTSEKIAYLTFDDGPVPEVTTWVLDLLREKGVRASFFCVGDNVRKHPEVYGRILSEGHVAGNHTYNHLNGWKASPGAYYNNVMRCMDYVDTKLFRPPHGRFSPAQYFILRNDFRFVLWSVLTMDYHQGVSPEQCLHNANSNLEPGAIVVFHDSIKAKEKLEYALPRFIEHALTTGYKFGVLNHNL